LRSLVVDKRDHIAGNCFDKYVDNNLIHIYGPHYFRTNSDSIFNYLSDFTEWIHLKYEILSWSDNQYWNFPINLNTFEQFIGQKSSEEDMRMYFEKNKINIDNPKNSEEIIISQVGYDLYNKFYKNYTMKQWNKHPSELDASVCSRIPIRTDRNNSYFNDKIQAMPKLGYTALFKNILDNKLIDVELNTDYKKISKDIFQRLVFTGPVDEYFDFQHGELPYRSLRFEKETHNTNLYQPAVQVNYPNDYSYTRIIETKHITSVKSNNTVIVKEYPANLKDTGERFYPVPCKESQIIYERYHNLCKNEKTIFIGRLATYRYLNMDQVIGMAINKANKIEL